MSIKFGIKQQVCRCVEGIFYRPNARKTNLQASIRPLQCLVGNYTYFNAIIICLFSNQVKHFRHILKIQAKIHRN